jgi:hypothetical protein
MKLHKDDPRLLQFVLNEISVADQNLILKAMSEQPEIKLEIQHLRKTFSDIESLSQQPSDMKLTAAQRLYLFNKTINNAGSVGFLSKFRQSVSIWTLSCGGLIAAMFAVLVFNHVLQTQNNESASTPEQAQNKFDSRTESLTAKSIGSAPQQIGGHGTKSSRPSAKRLDSSDRLNLAKLEKISLGSSDGAAEDTVTLSQNETDDLAKVSGVKERRTALARPAPQSQLIQIASENEKLSNLQTAELLEKIKGCIPEINQSSYVFNVVLYSKNKTVAFENEDPQLSVAQKTCLIMKLGAYSWPKSIDYRFKFLSVSK